MSADIEDGWQAWEGWQARSSLEDENAALRAELDMFKLSTQATNRRLKREGLVLFNYPLVPDGCFSNVQWRNRRAETAEAENARLREALGGPPIWWPRSNPN